MLFWIGILVGAAVTYMAVKMGFYETWVLLFNLTVAIYLGIFLRPLIADLVPAAGDTDFGCALTLLAVAGGVFAILHGLSFVFLTGQFKVPFPKIFDVVFSGILGFLAGLLIWSFASLLICVSPLAQESAIEKIGFSAASYDSEYLAWWCDLIHNFTASENAVTCKQAISDALKSSASTTKRVPAQQPVEPESPDQEGQTPPKKELGPPPEVGPEEL